METKEAILTTISELSKQENQEKSKERDDIDLNAKSNPQAATQDSQNNGANIFIDIKEASESVATKFDDEISTLLALREKSLVLFEGLKHSKDSSLEMKLEMTLNYLEYQLYIIEDRIKTLQDEAKNMEEK